MVIGFVDVAGAGAGVAVLLVSPNVLPAEVSSG